MKRSIQALTFAFLILSVATQIHAAGTQKGFITGKVMASSEKPVASVWVVIAQGKSEKGRSLTGDDGKYFIGNLKDGTYSITVKNRDRVLFRGRVELPRDRKHTVRLP